MHSVLRSHVASEVPRRTERLGAARQCTRIRSTSHVHLEMALQLVWLGEDASAVGVRTRQVLEQVQATMTSEVPRSTEALGTGRDRALVRFLSRVGLEVFAKGELAMESLVAVWLGAQECSLSRGWCAFGLELLVDLLVDWCARHDDSGLV